MLWSPGDRNGQVLDLFIVLGLSLILVHLRWFGKELKKCGNNVYFSTGSVRAQAGSGNRRKPKETQENTEHKRSFIVVVEHAARGTDKAHRSCGSSFRNNDRKKSETDQKEHLRRWAARYMPSPPNRNIPVVERG